MVYGELHILPYLDLDQNANDNALPQVEGQCCGAYTLQENTTIDGQIITAGELVVK